MFVVTAFMRSFEHLHSSDPMNRVTTNGRESAEPTKQAPSSESMNQRKIVHIDEEKCNGCGDRVPSCAEGAIQIIDGKARLVADVYCDGLGACLGNCPQDAINIIQRESDEFDEVAVEKLLTNKATTNAHLPIMDNPAPNPNQGSFFFSINKEADIETDGPVEVEVLDLTGKTLFRSIYRGCVPFMEYAVELEEPVSGFYLARFLYKDRLEVQKILVE